MSDLFLSISAELRDTLTEIEALEWAGLPEDEVRLAYLRSYTERLKTYIANGETMLPLF